MNTCEHFLTHLKRSHEFGPSLVYHKEIPKRAAQYAPPSTPLPPPLLRLLRQMNIERLYTHQAEALERVRKGQNVVVATPTSSGKTLVYTLPFLEKIYTEPEPVSALFVFPLKALEQDQQRILQQAKRLLEPDMVVRSAVYDGDTSPNDRKQIRSDPPHVLITNPDMLHMGILASHASWETFFRRLAYVVVDELHTYRGIFGSHMAQILRRLQRITAFYGSDPRYIFSSATILNPEEFSERLTGKRFSVVRQSGAPQGGRHFLFLNPETVGPAHFSARLFIHCLREGLKSIVFTQSRKVTELIHVWVKQMAPEYTRLVSSYRAGFLPEERRSIERDLARGALMGVISTSALEMGIDIGGLDVCILVGYPGTVMATWQRGGRVGREERDSIVALIAQPNALDQYFMHNPEDFFARQYERAIADPENSEVVKAHLPCAAAELELDGDDPFYPSERYAREYRELEEKRILGRNESGNSWFSILRNPHRQVSIRSVGETFTVMHAETQKVIGRVEGLRAFRECHPGAVYLHRATQYEILAMDFEHSNIKARAVDVPYYTRCESEKETEVLEILRSRPCENFLIKQGRVRVTERITGYEKRRIRGQELLSRHFLELPEQVFETVGVWIEIDDVIKHRIEDLGLHFMGGIHAMEHAAIAMFPLLALCDRNDVGGISYTFHPQVGKSAVFLYDGYPGGVGLVDQGYELIEELLEKTLVMVSSCECEDGCPSCIHSPKCGAGNKPLDKAACILCLELLLNRKSLGTSDAPSSGPRSDEPGVDKAETKRPLRIAYLDLETRRSAEEVGGWRNKHLMRVAVVVLYEQPENRFLEFYENDVGDLIKRLPEYDLVVGFNIKGFDYGVLSAYTNTDFGRISTFDILEYAKNKLGFRVSLDNFARRTLGIGKSGDGLQALEWFNAGEMEKVVEYCRKDVEITRDLFLFGLEKGHLLFEDLKKEVKKLSVDWNLDRLSRVPL
ncbi:MAG: DEAD/DEAH box helicase [Deltaproteobacteria bacterium]|nr:DEAD/DEAH box helicase [Deltaproteobacteria bacterium]